MEETKLLKNTRALVIAAIILGVISLFSSFVKNIIVERWANKRDIVACVPSDMNFSYPIVYRQTAANPIANDALIKSFVEEYIRLTQDEQIIEYHRVTNNQRYNNARLNKNLWRALDLSTGVEKALNMKKYKDSNDIFYSLKQGNMGWIFLIDDIVVYPSQKNGVTLVVIRGEFQVTYDKVKVDLPPKLWGYRELTLMINEGIPIEKKQGYMNKYGLFVSWSNMQILSPEQKRDRTKRSYDYYLMRDNEGEKK